MPSKNLDSGIINLHKALSNESIVNNRVRLNVTKFILLNAIRLHFLDRINCNAPLTMVNNNAYDTDEINHMRTHYLESRQSNELTAGLGEVKVPKLTLLKWLDFKSAISECLNRAVGKNNISLSYVIRKEQLGNFEEYYDTRREKLISCMSFTGPAFQADNSDVFSLLIQHTENTEGYTIVSNNENKRNGRKAWVELSSHFEGSTFKEWVAQEAVTSLKHASYSGPKRNFNFRYYCTLHTRAYAKLLRVDNPMTVEQQIDGFILGHPMCNCSKYSN